MVTRKLLERYLSGKLGDPKFTHQGLKYNCPVCDEGGKFNLEINMDRNIFNCWGCRYSGLIRKLLQEHATDTSWKNISEFKIVVEESEQVEQINYPTETIPFYLNKDVTNYLVNERGIDRLELIRRGAAYVYSTNETYHNHICFPFYEDGRLVGACLQNFQNKKYRNLGKLTFVPYKSFINVSYPIVITEGVYDALSGVNAIPMLRTEINKATLSFLRDKDVILAVDNTVDLQQYASLIKQLDKANVGNLTLFDMNVYKDMNEYYLKDKKSFIKELNACFKKNK